MFAWNFAVSCRVLRQSNTHVDLVSSIALNYAYVRTVSLPFAVGLAPRVHTGKETVSENVGHTGHNYCNLHDEIGVTRKVQSPEQIRRNGQCLGGKSDCAKHPVGVTSPGVANFRKNLAAMDEEDEDLTTCQICFEDYDMNERIPRFLPCTHTVCEMCIVQIISVKNKGKFRCP